MKVTTFCTHNSLNYITGCNLVETANITIPCYIWCSKVKSFVCEMVKSLNRYIYFWSLLNVIICFHYHEKDIGKYRIKQSGFSFVKRTSFTRSWHLFLKISLIFLLTLQIKQATLFYVFTNLVWENLLPRVISLLF